MKRSFSSASRRKPLPSVGPVTYYLPIRNGRPSLAGLTGERRRIAEAELRVLRGEFKETDRFYATIRKDGRDFLVAAGVALFGAVGSDDAVLFDTVLADIAAYPSRYGTPEAKLAVEIVMVWVRNFLHAPLACPKWLSHLDLTSVFPAWRCQVAYLAVECLMRKGEYNASEVLAEMLCGFDQKRMVSGTAASLYIRMQKALICIEEGRMDEVDRWYREAVASAKSLGIILPFLGQVLGPKSPLERVLAEDAPELLEKVNKQTNGYFRNLVKYHNRYTGDSVSEGLTPREFGIAGLVKRGFRYKEIAERMGVSEGRVRNTISTVYAALHIKRGSEIGDLVW